MRIKTALCVGLFALILSACLFPSHVIRIVYGNYPISDCGEKIKRGMTREKVQRIYGSPHERYVDGEGRESWFYYRDPFGFSIVGVRFDADGRVDLTWF